MPKRGTVKCQQCNWEVEGVFPDSLSVGERYVTSHGLEESERSLNGKLTETLEKHHRDTASEQTRFGGIGGHKLFDVFLEDGNTGQIEVSSYCSIYRECGKERN